MIYQLVLEGEAKGGAWLRMPSNAESKEGIEGNEASLPLCSLAFQHPAVTRNGCRAARVRIAGPMFVLLSGQRLHSGSLSLHLL